MRKKAIIGNWKMHKTNQETVDFMKSFLPFLSQNQSDQVIVGIAPTYLSLATASQYATDSLMIFSQNCHEEVKGAFTGEISIPMLLEVGIHGSIIGHSERRQYANETNEGCNRKIKALLQQGLIPLYCVGESLAQYEEGETKSYIELQLLQGLKGISPDDISKIMIAYEPIWSIGTGKNATQEIAQDICQFIRTLIARETSVDVASRVLILYGGSVKPENVRSYLSSRDVDGVLVGGASLTVPSFQTLIQAAALGNTHEN